MMECITDFNGLETVAKLAPIGTALIALSAAIIALLAILAQMHIARRRAAIDFFLKTEVDRTAIDLSYRRILVTEGIRRQRLELAI